MKREIVQAARRAAICAAEVCRTVQQDLGAIRQATKDDRSPVTVADFASQAVVCAALRDALGSQFSGGAMIAEEDATFLRRPDSSAYRRSVLSAVQRVRPEIEEASLLDLIDIGAGESTTTTFWTLDPVDGTKGFLRGQQYAIALAWIDSGLPSLGVLACPNLPADSSAPLDRADPIGNVYVAVRGSGVEQWPCAGDPAAPTRRLEPLAVAAERPVRACASWEKAHSSVGDTDRVLAQLRGDPQVIRVDSSVKYGLVARGQADAYLRLPSRPDYVEKIWDHAAGHVIVSEAGGMVSDIRGRPLDFSRGRGLVGTEGIIVARRDEHRRIIEAIAELGIG